MPKSLLTLPTARASVSYGTTRRGIISRPSSSSVDREPDLAPLAIEPVHAPEAVVEMVLVRLGDVINVVLVRVEGPGRDLVQQRLPQVGEVGVHERHVRLPAPAEAVAEPRRELDPAGAAADNDNAMNGHVIP